MKLNNLDNLLLSKNKSHAILIVDNKMSDLDTFINEYMKSILCDSFENCHDSCVWCQKINNNSYFDMITFDCYKKKILKDDVCRIKDLFSMTSMENKGKKFYILKGIELSTTQACNSLLKFLENPPNNTYAILTTRNLQQVLPTIQSRCQIYRLFTDEYKINECLSTYELSSLQKKIAKKIYYGIADLQTAMDDGSFLEAFNFASGLSQGYDDLAEIKTAADGFKKMDYYKIEKIILILKELMHFEKGNELLGWIDMLKLNPSRILLFNNLVKICDKGKYK